eukprot:7715452-Heterocapsa_arctica.AAC.1
MSAPLHRLAARIALAARRAEKELTLSPLDQQLLVAPLHDVLRELGRRLRPHADGTLASNINRARPQVLQAAQLLA